MNLDEFLWNQFVFFPFKIVAPACEHSTSIYFWTFCKLSISVWLKAVLETKFKGFFTKTLANDRPSKGRRLSRKVASNWYLLKLCTYQIIMKDGPRLGKEVIQKWGWDSQWKGILSLYQTFLRLDFK